MNIFVTSPDPKKCAQTLDNKRVIKMILETCQLLSTALNVFGGSGPYKTTHVNHPCSIWVRASRDNYMWTLSHLEALLDEYTKRYGKIHKCQQYVGHLWQHATAIPSGVKTPHVNCTDFKDESDVYIAYQKCLNTKWANDKRKPEWTARVQA